MLYEVITTHDDALAELLVAHALAQAHTRRDGANLGSQRYRGCTPWTSQVRLRPYLLDQFRGDRNNFV